MKGKEIIAHAVRAEIPGMEQLRKNIIRQAAKKGAAKQISWAKRLSAVTCLAALAAVSIAFPYFTDSNPDVPETNSALPSDLTMSMRGLPAENFRLTDAGNCNGSEVRLIFSDFDSLREWGIECFAVVKVYDIQKTESGTQISDAAVLQSIFGECGAELIQISQKVTEIRFCLGETKLLRKGGVYLLPLKQKGGKWYIMGDMDVLFEIDDKGKVWSHSFYEDFNRYDGKSIETVIEDLQNMFSEKDSIPANSRFSGFFCRRTLTDIKTASKKNPERINTLAAVRQLICYL